MKILIVQENGRHPKNRDFRECFNYQRAFNRAEINSTVWGLGHSNFSIPFEDVSKDADVILLLENYEASKWLPDLENIKKLKIFFSIDSHCALPHHQHLVHKHKIDVVLNAIESHQQYFKSFKTYYHPSAYPSDLIHPMPHIKKEIFLGFCGTLFDFRQNLILKLEEKFGIEVLRAVWWLGQGMVQQINSFKVHFNHTISSDINYRVFETMGCKTALLTNNTENLTTFFTDMEDVVIYSSEEELFEKVEFLMNYPDEIEKISNSGYENVVKNHTFDNRVHNLLQIINKNI